MTRPETSIAGMMVKSLIGIGVFLTGLVCPNVHAQQAIQFSQYFSNHLIINPAYAGAEDALSMTLVHRNQWTGVEGAPKTTNLSGHTLFRNEHTGIGMNLFVDKINIHSNLSFNGVYSYRIRTGDNSYLSLGLSAGLNHQKSDYTALLGTIYDPNDPGIRFEELSATVFQVGTGAYFMSPRVEVGLSAPVLYSSEPPSGSDIPESPNTVPHYFIFTKVKIPVSQSVEFRPGFLIKSKRDWPLSYDINMEAIYRDVLMLALSYRSQETLSTIVQFKVLPQMTFGYAYDIPLSDIQRRNFNSHELMLKYVFKYKDYQVSSPR